MVHGTDWATLRRSTTPEIKTPLFRELCRRFHSKDRAMLCAISYGQVSIDGYVIRERHLDRWPVDRLCGRYARLHGQQAQLFGSTPVGRYEGSGDSSRGA